MKIKRFAKKTHHRYGELQVINLILSKNVAIATHLSSKKRIYTSLIAFTFKKAFDTNVVNVSDGTYEIIVDYKTIAIGS